MGGVQRRTLRVLAATQVFGASGAAVAVAVSTMIAAELSGSAAVGGLAQTSTVLGTALLAVPASGLAIRRGRRPALLFGYALGAAGAALAVLAVGTSAWPALLAALILFGGGTTANLAARYAATDLARPQHRARALSTVVWGSTVGAVAGPNLAGPAGWLSTRIGLPAGCGPFLLAMLAFGVAAAGVSVGLRPDPLLLARTSATAGSGSRAPAVVGAAVWRAMPPRARLALAGVAICHTAMVAMMSMTPVHMGHGGASLRVVGVVISLHIAAMYAASPLFGWMADRLGRVPVLAIGAATVVAAAAVCGLAHSQNAPQLAGGLVLLGVGWSAGMVSGSTLLTESVRVEVRPAAQGLSDLAMNVGGVLAGVCAGIVVTVWSYAVLGLVVGFVALPFLVACMLGSLRPAR
jgi:MFS family permease